MSAAGPSLYVGTVERNVIDPDGCIEVNIPALGGTFSARLASSMAGPDRGMVFLPEQQDQVLVAAVTGSDVRWVVLGSLWSRNEKPPLTNADGKNDIKIIKTRAGNTIRLCDGAGQESIEIVDSSGDNRIRISSATQEVTITAASGTLTLRGATVHIEATDGDVVIQGGPNVQLNPPASNP